MTTPPLWLSELQSSWSKLLRDPLDSSAGTFRERREAYPATLRAAVSPAPSDRAKPSTEDRLALYHQQYWMRLFTALQGCLPRFALALGYWHFNHLASLHLHSSPPHHFDLERAADGLDTRIERALGAWELNVTPIDAWTARLAASRAPRALLKEALQLDRQERRVFEAPLAPRWRPTPYELAALSSLRVRTAPSLELVTETWDLLARSSLTDPTTAPAPLRKLPARRHWALYRTETSIARLQLSKVCWTFLESCRHYPFGQALARLETSLAPRDLATLHAELPQWIQLALNNHWWTGAL